MPSVSEAYLALEIRETLKKDKFFKIHTSLKPNEFEEFLDFLLSHITIFPEEEYAPFITRANQEVPEDDSPYLALSIALRIPIWSNDAAFQNQSLAQVYTTSEIVKILKRHY